MTQVYGYMQGDFNLSENFIEKFKGLKAGREALKDDAIGEGFKTAIDLTIEVIISDLKNDISKGTRIFFDETIYVKYEAKSICKALLSTPLFYWYLIKQLNTCLKHYIFKEFPNEESFIKEMVDEKTSFYLNFNSGQYFQMFSLIRNDNNPVEALQFINEQKFEMIFNKNLLNKLPDGVDNSYINFQTKMIDYLNVKITTNNIQKIANNL